MNLTEGLDRASRRPVPSVVLVREVFEAGDVALGVVKRSLQAGPLDGFGGGALLPIEAVTGVVGVVELFGVERRPGVEDALLVAFEAVEFGVVELVEGNGEVSVDLVLRVVVGGSRVWA